MGSRTFGATLANPGGAERDCAGAQERTCADHFPNPVFSGTLPPPATACVPARCTFAKLNHASGMAGGAWRTRQRGTAHPAMPYETDAP